MGVISKQTRDILARIDLSEEEKESQIKTPRTIENRLTDQMRVREKIDLRLTRDLEVGRSARNAKNKARKRKRAGLRRAKGRAERAKGKIASDNLWHEKHENPEQNPNPKDFVNITQAIPGIEANVKRDETLERRPLTRREKLEFTTECSGVLSEAPTRSWVKSRLDE